MDNDRIAWLGEGFCRYGRGQRRRYRRRRKDAGSRQRPRGDRHSAKPLRPRQVYAARDAADAAVGYAKDAYENSGDTFRDGSQPIAKKVQDNTLGSVLIAGGIGFALALMMTRPPPRRWPYYG